MNKRTIGISALGTISLILLSHAVGVRGNLSDSAPVGLWIKRPIDSDLQRDMMIGVCPPPTVPVVRLFSENGTLSFGQCPETNVALLLKPVRALPGDVVRISRGREARVNGTVLANTIAEESITAWPDGEYVVSPGEVWIFSSYNPKSFDSRYFGPIKIKDIQSQVFPLAVTG